MPCYCACDTSYFEFPREKYFISACLLSTELRNTSRPVSLSFNLPGANKTTGIKLSPEKMRA